MVRAWRWSLTFTRQVGLMVMLQDKYWRCLVQIFVETPGILTEVFRCFSQSLQVNARRASWLGHDYVIWNPFQFISHSIIWRSIVQILTELWNTNGSNHISADSHYRSKFFLVFLRVLKSHMYRSRKLLCGCLDFPCSC